MRFALPFVVALAACGPSTTPGSPTTPRAREEGSSVGRPAPPPDAAEPARPERAPAEPAPAEPTPEDVALHLLELEPEELEAFVDWDFNDLFSRVSDAPELAPEPSSRAGRLANLADTLALIPDDCEPQVRRAEGGTRLTIPPAMTDQTDEHAEAIDTVLGELNHGVEIYLACGGSDVQHELVGLALGRDEGGPWRVLLWADVRPDRPFGR